jgi:arylsulfatase A-like enzyme
LIRAAHFPLLALGRVLLLGFLGLAALGCQEPRFSERQRAILIVLDAARADRVGFHGYDKETTPYLDALAQGALVGDHHYTHHPTTRAAIPALFYSRYFTPSLFPSHRMVPVYEPAALFRTTDDQAFSLPAAFEEAGYLTAGISAHSWMQPGEPLTREFQEFYRLKAPWHPTGRWTGRIWEGLKWILPGGDRRRLGVAQAHEVIDEGLSWIASNSDRDFFLYLHLMDTHTPHRFGADAMALVADKPGRIERLKASHRQYSQDDVLNAREKTLLDALYDGSLRYTDRELGRFFATLARWGILTDTLIVVTSDHGEALLDVPGRFGHGGPLYESKAHIPLVIHKPDAVESGRIPGFSGLVDIAPTMMELMGVPLLEGMHQDGMNLLEIALGRVPPQDKVVGIQPMLFLDELSRGKSQSGVIRDQRFKLFLTQIPSLLDSAENPLEERPRGQLYDLHSDPLETNDVWDLHPEEVERLTAAYQALLGPGWARHMATRRDDPPPTPFAVDVGTLFIDMDLRYALPTEGEKILEKLVSRTGWIRASGVTESWLLAGGGTESCTFEFELPDGQYRVSALAGGRGTIRVGGASPTLVDTGKDRLQPLEAGGEVGLGTVEIRDRTFRVRIEPAADAPWFFVRRFGFEPLGWSADSSKEDEERLRTLGYIQ